MVDKEILRKRLLKKRYESEMCFICNLGISKDDIKDYNFEMINNKYIHNKCLKKYKGGDTNDGSN